MTPDQEFTELITEDNLPELGEEVSWEDTGVSIIVAFDPYPIAKSKEKIEQGWDHEYAMRSALAAYGEVYDGAYVYFWLHRGTYRRPALVREILKATS